MGLSRSEAVTTACAAVLTGALVAARPALPGPAVMLLAGAGLLMAAVHLQLLDRPAAAASGRQRWAKGFALVLALLGTTQVVGALSGGDDLLQPLRHFTRDGNGAPPTRVDAPPAPSAPPRAPTGALADEGTDFRLVRNLAELDAALNSTHRPVMLEFDADGCAACREMEHRTFSHPEVRSRVSRALLLHVDVTANSAESRALLQRFGLYGPSGILFFDARGREQADARVIGFVSAQRFMTALSVAGL